MSETTAAAPAESTSSSTTPPAGAGVSRGLATLVLYLLAVFFTVKVAAAYVLMDAGSGLAPFVAVVPGMWGDVLLTTLFFWVAFPLRHTRWSWGPMPLAVAVGVFAAGSWTSFLVTQTWMTWQRLRGDENVTLKDVNQLGEYLAPGIALIAVAVLWLPVVVAVVRKAPNVVEKLQQKRTGLVLPAVALGLFVLDTFTAPMGLYGLSEQPVLEVARSAFVKLEKATEPLPPSEFKKLHRPLTSYDEGPPPSAPMPPKNTILYLAEGIPTKHTSFSGVVDTTPNLHRRWQDHGLFFDRYYTHTHRSIHALFSTVCSHYPPATVDAMSALHPRIDCGSLMETLDGLDGMHQGLFHGGRFSFANKLALLARRGFDVTVDTDDLSDPSKWEETWWGMDDRAVVQAALDFVDSVPKDERFFLMIVPIAPHEPYDVPKNAGVEKRIKGGTKKTNRFLRAVKFSDMAFEQLMQGLETRGRYNDTLTVYAPDHGNYVGEPARPTRGKRMIYEGNVKVPLVFLHPGSWTGQTSHRLAAQLDLSPTITAVMGAEPDPRDWGQNVFGNAYERKRVYLLKTRGTEPYVGLVDGHWKFIHEISTGRSELYDLSVDADERNNVVEAHPALVRKWMADGLRVRQAQRKTLLAVPALEEKDGDAGVLFDKAKLVCAEDGSCKGATIKSGTCKGKWTKAPCLTMNLPKDSKVEIALPSSLVGAYDSVRVRWWNRERRLMGKAKMTLRYGDKTFAPTPQRSRNDGHRVFPVPHVNKGDDVPLILHIETSARMKPMVELFEH